MKPLLTAALLFLSVNCQAVTYYQVQHGANIVKKSTTTFVNTWELRGNIEIGVDTHTVTLDNVTKNVVLLGTGTVRALRIEGNGSALMALTPSNIGAGYLPSTVIASSIAVASVGVPQIKATGSPSGTTFLAGDGTWSSPTGTGGDAVLADTQTWTGGNTFTGSTTISSATVTNLTVTNINSTNLISSNISASSLSTGGKHWEIIYTSTTISISSMTIIGLNGNVDNQYKLTVHGAATSAGASEIYIYFNGDEAANYDGTQHFSGDTQGTSALIGTTRARIGYIGSTGGCIDCFIFAKSGNFRVGLSQSFDAYNVFRYDHAFKWANSTDNITSITIRYLTINIGASSVVTLWALR